MTFIRHIVEYRGVVRITGVLMYLLCCSHCLLSAQTWQYVTSEFFGGDRLNDSRIVLAGRHGAIFVVSDTLIEERRQIIVSLPETGTYRNLYSVCSVDDTVVLVGGEDGIILHSTDRGQSWTSGNLDSESPVIGLIRRGQEVLAFTESEIFSSVDSGYSWTGPETPGGGIRDLVYLSDSVGFLLDTTGILKRTENAGDTWSVVMNAHSTRMLDVEVHPENGMGVVVGDSSTLFLSEDFGLTWQEHRLPGGNVHLTCAAVQDDGAVIVGGEVPGDNFNAPAVYRSIDTGSTWQGIRLGPTQFNFRVNSLVRGVSPALLVLGNQGRLYSVDPAVATVDTISHTYHFTDLSGPSISNAEPGVGRGRVALYGSQAGGFCHRTEDGGVTWQQILIQPEPINGFEVFENGDALSLSDNFNFIRNSTDEGKTWSWLQSTGTPPLSGTRGRGLFEFPTHDSGVALLTTGINDDQQAHFYVSNDHGRSFTGSPVEDVITWTNLDFPLPQVGLAAGFESPDNFDSSEGALYHGIILRTTDRGESWTPVFRGGGDFGYPSGLAMLSESEYLAGVDGGSVGVDAPYALIRTTNGGSTWTPVAEAPSIITDIVPFSDSTIVAVGWLGLILQSNDRGATWERYEFDVPPYDTIRQGPFVQAVLPNFENVALLPDRQTALIFGNSAVLRARFDSPFPPVSEIVLSVDEEAPQGSPELFAFPNPAIDVLYVDLSRTTVRRARHVLLYDPLGRRVGDWTVRQAHEGLDVAAFPPGSYMLRIYDDENREIGRQAILLIR